MKERTALITGASRGIGKAIAIRFKDLGATVLDPSRTELDLSSDDSVDSYLANLKEPVDILVNNAGINPLADVTELSDEDISETMKVNLISPLRLIRGLAPGMIQRRYGRIVNISSIWGSVSKPRRLAYSISKTGLNGMTRSLAVELAEYDITVNAISPGFVNTELTSQNNSPAELAAIAGALPVKRLAEPEEIAEITAFFCSEKNSFTTGQVILADGGYSCL